MKNRSLKYLTIDDELILDTIPDTDIRSSQTHGRGLFSLRKINKGETLAYLDGQHIPWKAYTDFDLDTEWNAVAEDLLLVRFVKTKYFFINHSRTPNLKVSRDPISVVALTDIDEGAELTLDYRMEPLPKEYLAGHGATYL